jgi:signal transduction histidine kinase
MSDSALAHIDAATIECALLSVLLEAETAREGAAALLDALAPVFDDCHVASEAAVALAVREREGLALHVLVERGAPHKWPAALEPRFAVSGQTGIDPATEAMVVPLRANGRVVGALMFGSAAQAGSIARDGAVAPLLETTAAVLDALIARTQAILSRRAIAVRSVETVLEGMAHQMANPLTGASAVAQLLATDLQDEGQRAAVKQISHELGRAFTVLQDMLTFHGDTGAHAGVLDLNAIAERVTRFRGYAIREQGITMRVETLTDTAPVRADARALEHALLIALRFAEMQSRGSVNRSIEVRVVESSRTEVAIEITDSGPGNVPELTTGYFDLPFNEALTARGIVAGTPDLGLLETILRGAGGRLGVRASKADGTTLSLFLPVAVTGNHSAQGKKP